MLAAAWSLVMRVALITHHCVLAGDVHLVTLALPLQHDGITVGHDLGGSWRSGFPQPRFESVHCAGSTETTVNSLGCAFS